MRQHVETVETLSQLVIYLTAELAEYTAALAKREQLVDNITIVGSVEEAKANLQKASDFFHLAVAEGDKELIEMANEDLITFRLHLQRTQTAEQALETFNNRLAVRQTRGSQLQAAKAACEQDLRQYTARLQQAKKKLEAEEAKKQRENRVKVLAAELKKLESAQYSYGVVPARTSKIRDIKRELRELGVNHAQRSSVREVAATARVRA